MTNDADDLLPTRWSLLTRLKNWDDQASWQEFFDTYWKLIYGVGQTGLERHAVDELPVGVENPWSVQDRPGSRFVQRVAHANHALAHRRSVQETAARPRTQRRPAR